MYALIRTFVLALCCTAACSAFAQQTPYLEKPVTIRNSTLSYAELFKQLSSQTGVVFSYTNFDDNRKVTVQYAKKPLRIVLNDLFNSGGCTYKLKGKYVILTCKTIAKPKPESAATVLVNGYIYDAADSSLVAQSSVYLRQNRQSAVTNDYGYFSMNFPKTSDVLSISVAKENYEDTTVVILSRQRNTVVIYLQPKAPPVKITIDDTVSVVYQPPVDTTSISPQESLPEEPFDFWNRFRNRQSNLRNISDTLFTTVSFSFVPPLSTNRLLGVNTVNRYSFNLLAGYSKGVDVLEIGGLVNLDHGNVQYVQLAGLMNLVSGTSRGVQIAGMLNTVGSDVEGAQVAGLFNVDRANLDYVQAAGIGNVVFGSVYGAQVAGIFNVTGTGVDGFQLAGICNAAPKVKGMQLAGISNLSFYQTEGFQLAGIANTTDSITGGQLAGIANNAQYVKGFQLSGILNRAGQVDGTQLGFINVARSISGVPIGFFSYVREGYHKIELATDENLLTTLSFRTGVDAFHNIFIAGTQFSGSNRLWTFGYGLGSAIRLSDHWYLNADLTSQQVQLAHTGNVDFNQLTKAYFGVEWRIAKKFSIAAGPTLNWLSSDINGTDYQLVQDRFHQPTIYSSVGSSFSNQLWIGGRLSLKFL